jgi:uncharacterized protein YndB with AHSA1/START domain
VNDEMSLPVGIAAERWIRLERSFRAPTDRVFRVWTDPEELIRWLSDRVEGSLAPASRSVLVWRRRRLPWDVVSVEPNRRLVVRIPWLPDESLFTTLTVTLEPEGYGTRLRLEDGPFPIDQPATFEAWEEALEAWVETLAGLRAYVDFSVDLRPRP